ncbi:MAG: hypothetical protein R3C49_16475 [Planctomycetaceae bacterium]
MGKTPGMPVSVVRWCRKLIRLIAPPQKMTVETVGPTIPVANFSAPVVNFSAPHGDFSAPHGDFSAPHGDFSAPDANFSAPHGDFSAPVASCCDGEEKIFLIGCDNEFGLSMNSADSSSRPPKLAASTATKRVKTLLAFEPELPAAGISFPGT